MQRLTASLVSKLCATSLAMSLGSHATKAHADSASDLHAQLKERWYTTEMVIFRYVTPNSTESLSFAGERLTAAEYRTRLLNDEPEALEISVLTLGDTPEDPSEDTAEIQRPALDVEPGEEIQDYGNGEDLGALVAYNMATWENQLRNADGKALTVEQLTLTEQAAKLTSNRSTEVLVHTGWTQAVPERGNGTALEIAGGDRFVDPRNGDSRSRLEGEVTVTLGRYLHVQPTLFYTPEYTPEFPPVSAAEGSPVTEADAPNALTPIPSLATSNSRTGAPQVRDLSSVSALDRLRGRAAQADTEAQPPGALDEQRATDFEQELPPYMRLEQSRRVRSGELHYIDHPEIGVLVRVTPVAAPALLQEQFSLLQ